MSDKSDPLFYAGGEHKRGYTCAAADLCDGFYTRVSQKHFIGRPWAVRRPGESEPMFGSRGEDEHEAHEIQVMVCAGFIKGQTQPLPVTRATAMTLLQNK